MGLNVAVGTITQPGETGLQRISVGTGFAPKAIIMWATPQTSDGAAVASASLGMGMGTYRSSAVSMGYVAYYSVDTGASSATSCGTNTTSLLRLFSDGAATVDLEIDLDSMSDDAVTINWVNLHTTASIRIHYMIIGGSDVTDALVHNFTITTTVSTQDVTVASAFGKPDLVICMLGNQSTLGDEASHGQVHLGVGNAAGEVFSTNWKDRDGSNTMDVGAWNKANLLSTYAASGAPAVSAEATLAAYADWPTDGFRLSYSFQAEDAYQVICLALKGTFTSKVSSMDSPTSEGDTDVTLASGTAKGALCFACTGPGTTDTIDTTSSNLGAFNLGAFDSDSEAYAGAGNDDGDANADTGVSNSTSKAFSHLKTDGTPADLTAADGVLTGSTARLSWTTVDAAASHRVGVLVLGQIGSDMQGLLAQRMPRRRSNLRS